MPETEPAKPKRAAKKKAQPSSDELNLTELVSELRGEITSLRSDVSELRTQIQTSAEPAPVIDEEEGLSEAEFGALLEATSNIGQTQEPDPIPEETAMVIAPQQSVALTDEEIAALFAEQAGQPQSLDQSPETDTLIVPAEEIMAMLGLADPASETTPEATTLAIPTEEAAVAQPEVSGEVLAEEASVVTQVEDVAPSANLDEIDPSAVSRVPGHLAAAALALPLCVVEDQLHCRCIEPFDDEALKAISESTGLHVVPHRGEPTDVLQELRRRFGNTDEACVSGAASSPTSGGVRSKFAKLLRREG